MTDSASTQPDKADSREKVIFTYWLWPAIGIPFLILGWWGGFGEAFQSGAASAFMCGAIIAAIGECVIENYKDGFTHLTAMLKTPDKYRTAAFGAVILAIVFFFLNMYFAVADKKVPHSSVDWVQVTAFIVAAMYLPQARFAFTGKPPTLFASMQSNWDTGYRFGKKIGGAHDVPPVPAVAVAEVQADEAAPPSATP